MKRISTLLPAAALAVVSSLIAAQQASTPQNSPGDMHQHENAPANPNGMQTTAPGGMTSPAVPVPSTANTPEATNGSLRPVKGELVTKIDSKSAKPGQSVVVKTTEKATTANGVVIPKGSKIVGHVTQVQAHSKQTPNSQVTVKFDEADLKNGQKMPIQSVLQSVGSAADQMAANENGMGAGTPMSAPNSGAPMTGAPGTAGGATATMPSTNSTMAAQGNTAAGNGAPAPGTVVATQNGVAVKTTAIPGVLIASEADGKPTSNASGALVGARQNVHLDGGTKVVLAIAEMPSQNGNGGSR